MCPWPVQLEQGWATVVHESCSPAGSPTKKLEKDHGSDQGLVEDYIATLAWILHWIFQSELVEKFTVHFWN